MESATEPNLIFTKKAAPRPAERVEQIMRIMEAKNGGKERKKEKMRLG